MCRSLQIGQRHPMHCLSHQSSGGVWARYHVQQPAHERHRQHCVTACGVHMLFSARGTQPKLNLMADLTVIHRVAYHVSSSKTTYTVSLDESSLLSHAGIGQQACELSHHQQCNRLHQWCKQHLSATSVICGCRSS